MRLSILLIACLSACAGTLPSDQSAAAASGQKDPPARQVAVGHDGPVGRGDVDGNLESPSEQSLASPAPATHSLDERVVLWVDAFQRQRGLRGLSLLSAGGDLEAQLRFARARAVLGHTIEAEQAFRAIITAEPNCAAAQLGLARVLMSYGRYAAAAEALDVVRELEAAGKVVRSGDTAWMLGACLLQGETPELGDKLLRQELVNGPGFGSAALVLANDHAGREAYEAALAIIAAARQRAPERLDLFLARVRLLADLWRHRQVVPELRAWLVDHPDDTEVRERLVLSLRAIEDPTAALSELGRMILPVGQGDVERQLMLGHLADDLEHERRGGNRRYSAAELLAILRGSDEPALRRRAFDALLAADETRGRAIFVAWQQPFVELRVAVVKACVPGEVGSRALLRDALADEHAFVRGAAATSCGELDRDDGIPLLTAALAVEEDPYAFRCVHEALQRFYGPVVHLPLTEGPTAAERARTLKAWRQIWKR